MSNAKACDIVGISMSAFTDWMNTKEDFAVAIKKARADRTNLLVKCITKEAFSGTWQAAAWLLERTEPEEYGKSVAIKTDDGQMHEFIEGMNKIINGK